MAYCRCFLILLCITSIVAKKHEDVVKETQEALKKIHGTWEAGVNEEFKGKDTDDIAKLNGYTGSSQTVQTTATTHTPTKPQIGRNTPPGTTLPDTFDWRTQTASQSVGQIRNQLQCGSCWAVSSSSVMSDRYFLWTNKNVFLSARQLMDCVNKGNVCGGNNPYYAMQYVTNNGITTGGDATAGEPAGCLQYTIATQAGCPSTCDNNSTITEKYYKGGQFYALRAFSTQAAVANEQKIMQEVYNYGPVTIGITVYEDFQAYKSGVYSHVSGVKKGGHAMRLIGWGVENGVKYWLLANSWGKYWGINGYMKFLRGADECGIEEDVTTVYPPEAY